MKRKSLESFLSEIKALSKAIKVVEERDNSVRVEVPRSNLENAVKTLYKCEKEVFLRTMVASDERPVEGVFKVYYVFGIDSKGVNVVFEVPLPAEDPKLPTLIGLVKAIDWYELEASDLLGVRFENRKLSRFVLPYDWPDNIYPLRKDYIVEDLKRLYRARLIEEAREIGAEEVFVVPIGPYHPALHEPEYFELFVKGEKVIDAKYVGFMVHRGIEKLGEGLKYDQVSFLAERICGICGFVHSTSYCQAIEDALKIEVPERALFIRSILLEIERLHSHLLWFGVALHLLGYDTGFMHAWRIREDVMILAELLTGSRKTYGINVIGGVRRDISKEHAEKVLKVLDKVMREFEIFVEVATSVPQVKARLSGTGILPHEEALALSLVGPTARGSGLNRDVRRDYPYAAYKYVDFKVPVYKEGDNMARALVRIEEVFESVDIIKQLLDKMPSGDIRAESWSPEPLRIGIGSVEAPRGEVVHFVVTSTLSPYRWRVRTPTYQNLPALPIMLKECDLADVPITIASIDPCFSCTDRVVVVNVAKGTVKSVPLTALSIHGKKVLG